MVAFTSVLFDLYELELLLIRMLTSSQAYDSHCNIVLGEVEETVYVVEEDENENETVKVSQS